MTSVMTERTSHADMLLANRLDNYARGRGSDMADLGLSSLFNCDRAFP